MKTITTPRNLCLLLSIAGFGMADARPDTAELYDENVQNTATVGVFYTNHPSGYAGFVADIAAAWSANEGGVIDEFARNGQYSSFQGQSFITGYGAGGYYDPTTLVSLGSTIQLDTAGSDWDLTTNGSSAAPAISFDYYMTIGSRSQGQKIFMTTSTGLDVTQLGFTILGENTGTITAVAQFSDGTSYLQEVDGSEENNAFFGAAAPEGAYIRFFAIATSDGGSAVIDDLAFSTALPVPETSSLGLAIFGLALVIRRRR